MNTKNYQKEFSKESIDIYLKKLSKVFERPHPTDVGWGRSSTENALKTLANNANKLGKVDIKAYVLQAISNLNDSKKTSFRL